jgi:hypothetical protein
MATNIAVGSKGIAACFSSTVPVWEGNHLHVEPPFVYSERVEGNGEGSSRRQGVITFPMGTVSGIPLPRCQCGCGEAVAIRRHTKRRIQFGFYSHGHDRRGPSWHRTLSELQRQAVLGTLLGDCSIGYPHETSRAPRLSTTHSVKQFEWAAHKADFLLELSPHIRIINCGGYGEQSAKLTTACSECLIEINDLVRGDGPKRINRRWLDSIGDIGLAWWFCDDGSCSGPASGALHTEGYSLTEVEEIISWLRERFGVGVRLQESKGRYLVRFRKEPLQHLLRVIAPFVPDCMAYKLRFRC